ncbi:hypothetical protein DFH28DRAFT_902163 [Melampsora americana]|nr:hypothetical protein DFH28DRAFT_902163 [Melampsora americana]
MPVTVNIRRQGLPIPDDQLPIKLGQVVIPPHLHKFLSITEGREIRATHAEIFELITCFHPNTDFNIYYTDIRTLIRIYEILALPWMLAIESMDYETNIMKFCTE